MLLGTCLGLAVHVIVTCGITNRPLIHAAEGQLLISVFEVYGLPVPVVIFFYSCHTELAPEYSK